MIIQEIYEALEKCDSVRLDAQAKSKELKKALAEKLEEDEFDSKLAAMKPAKRAKFLKKLGKTDEEIVEIEKNIQVIPTIKVEANVAKLGVVSSSSN